MRVLNAANWLLRGVVAFIVITVCAAGYFVRQADARETQDRATAAPASGRFVRAGDISLFVQEVGPADAPVVLFIHGTGAWGEIWRGSTTALAAAGYRCIAVDMPPFGYSERPMITGYSRHEQARRLVALLDGLNVRSVMLVGHSFGGGAT